MGVSHTAPSGNEDHVPSLMPVSATFSQNVSAASVQSNSFIVRGEKQARYGGSYSVTSNRIVFRPYAAYRPGDRVTADMGSSITSTVPENLAPYQLLFIARAQGCGNGRFAYSTNTFLSTTNLRAMVAGDLDGDGDEDLVVAGTGSNRVYLNAGSGLFTTNSAFGATNGAGLALGDLDGDGDLDVVAADDLAGAVHLNDGTGTFTPGSSLGSGGRGVAVGDIDGDGDLDVIVAASGPNRVYLNNGSGSLSAGGTYGTTNNTGVAMADLDGDGDLDAFVTRLGPNMVFRNNGSGVFTTNALLGRTNFTGVALGDLDGDGDADAFVSSTQTNRVFLNAGNASFTTNAALGRTNCRSVALGDMDGDGDLDALVGCLNPASVYLNNGTATFTTNTLVGPTNILSVALGDLDNDGDLDAALGPNGPALVLRNDASCFLVTNTSPADSATGAPRNDDITIQFSAAQSNATVTARSFKAWARLSGIHTGTYTHLTSEVSLQPTTPFLPGEEVVVMLNANAKAADGRPLKPHVADFHVAVADCPSDGAVYGAGYSGYGKPTVCFGARIAELTGDGYLDVIQVMSFNSNHLLYVNSGHGTFTTNVLNFGSDANDVDVGDVNGDNKPDMVIANYGQLTQVYTNSGTGTFGLLQSLGPAAINFGVRLGDLDGDGDLDAFRTGFGADAQVYFNTGNGTFVTNQTITLTNGFSVDLGDVDADGDLDAFMCRVLTNTAVVLLNNGSGLFTTNQQLGAADNVHGHLGDLDADGDLDALVTVGNGPDRVYLNYGNGTFYTNQLLSPLNNDGIALGDLDGDGDLDACISSLTNQNFIYLNNGDGFFTTNDTLASGPARVAELGDLDADGDLDAFLVTTGTLASAVWFNEPPAPNVTPVFLAPGSPSVTANPSPSQNNVGDNLDLATAGNAALMVDRCGFGDLGQVYFNYDASNLHVGAHGLDLGGSSNALALFLGLNTLTNNVTNLLLQTGDPKALDRAQNLRFNPGIDLAIVVGDEYGDTNAASFNLGSGEDVGQGVFHVYPASFAVVTNARVSQFDGTGTTPTASADDDADRVTDRWEVSIPWSALGATDSAGVTSLYVSGVIMTSTNGNSRYLSSNFIGTNATRSGRGDYSGNFAYATVTVFGVQLVLPSRDSDGDGMPNGFELGYGLNPTNASDAASDGDGDGQNNTDEYVGGTIPNDGTSYFDVDRTVFSPARIQFDALTGRVYDVFFKTNLTDGTGWQAYSTNIVGTNGTISVTDTNTASVRHFRVRVKMAP
jgi:hypothetical protein